MKFYTIREFNVIKNCNAKYTRKIKPIIQRPSKSNIRSIKISSACLDLCQVKYSLPEE
ncbi:TVG0779096 [Thermoplasma volcanium GSS1]|uniref:TVG0779096 protein n=1 Tax=Thermoplasma volcanium (strain ATCC 51530 / DSM 4299 / JCM 9571 / NBRC 15438 / GSS1) TaxID=273116 RepID=Q97AN6_THEVO|nr:TVG0779096 [Thermoplasma volcanium GSS1]